jgi:hypothetical protein
MATCETNYCPTCDQPHVCDTTCVVPCELSQLAAEAPRLLIVVDGSLDDWGCAPFQAQTPFALLASGKLPPHVHTSHGTGARASSLGGWRATARTAAKPGVTSEPGVARAPCATYAEGFPCADFIAAGVVTCETVDRLIGPHVCDGTCGVSCADDAAASTVEFEAYDGGIWNGVTDQASAVAFAWDAATPAASSLISRSANMTLLNLSDTQTVCEQV